MQPMVSTIHARGQAEIGVNLRPNGRVEGSVAYSPLPNLLVLGAGAYRPKLGDTLFMATKQWELGVGTYWPLGPNLSAYAVGGYGQAHSQKTTDWPLTPTGTRFIGEQDEARYNKIFGQLSVAYQDGEETWGLVYRLSRNHFTQLDYRPRLDSAALAVPLQNLLRHESLFFYRENIGSARQWQIQVNMGLSVNAETKNLKTIVAGKLGPDRQRAQALYSIYGWVPMMSIGVTFRPQLHRAKAAPVSAE